MDDGERVRLRMVDEVWDVRYARWAERLREALGDVFDGGALADVAHVGSTAVPGLLAKPTLDLMARIDPWPPSPTATAALAQLGFEAHGEHGLSGRSYFTWGGHDVHLHLVDTGSRGADLWTRHLALRDLLRDDPEARSRYATVKRSALEAAAAVEGSAAAREAYARVKSPVIRHLEREALAARVARLGFGPPRRVASWLADVPERWALHGGWALDAWVGAPARLHEDVDVAVDRRLAVLVLDRLTDQGVDVGWLTPSGAAPPGLRRRRAGETAPPGVFRARARRDETWIDVVLEPWGEDVWRYRRDPRVSLSLGQALIEAVVEGHRLPLLAPEVVLFVKTARQEAEPLAKDEDDLRRVWPRLTAPRRRWLREALAMTSPAHAWLARWPEDGVVDQCVDGDRAPNLN